MAPGRDELRELAFPRLAHDDLARDRVRRGGSGATEKALRPRRDHVAGIGCVLAAREQVVGGVERDEALRVQRRLEDARRVVDRDRFVARRVHDEERLAQVAERLVRPLAREIVEQLPADPERPSTEDDLGLAGPLDLVALRDEREHVRGIGRRGDGGDADGLRDLARGREHGGAAEAVPDEELRGAIAAAQEIDGRDQIGPVRREVRVGEVPAAAAEPGEVEAQAGDAALGERRGDVRRGARVLRAGEAVREEGVGDRRRERGIQARAQGFPGCARELDLLGVRCHRVSFAPGRNL